MSVQQTIEREAAVYLRDRGPEAAITHGIDKMIEGRIVQTLVMLGKSNPSYDPSIDVEFGRALIEQAVRELQRKAQP